MLYADLLDVAIEVFGGYCPAIAPTDLPPGASPLCQDVFFPQGAVKTRGGLAALYPGSPIPVNASINGLKSFLTSTLAQRLMVWDSLGNFYKENPQGTLSLIAARPQGAGSFYQSDTIFGREYQAFSSIDIPRQFDDTNWDRVSQCGPGQAPTAVDAAPAGNISIGKHQVTVAFITRQGFITQPAPPFTWTAAGSKQVSLTNIAVGPPNIVARLILFTPVIVAPATTGTFYSIPTGTTQLATPTVMLIADNTTTAITLDFTDAILIASFNGQYLFTQRVLGECSYTNNYNSRTLWIGERNHQQNFVNLDFDGGFGTGNPIASSPTDSPSTSFDEGPGGSGRNVWTNLGNLFVLDGAVASSALAAGNITNFLGVRGYGFNIPLNATINGIIVKVYCDGSIANVISDVNVFLEKAGVRVGSDHKNGNLLGNVIAAQTYGNSSDLWGTTWTPAQINNAGFGLGIVFGNFDFANARTVNVDYISIQVFYTVPASLTVAPLGWTAGASFAGGGSALANGLTGDWMDAFSINGDGATAVRGQITQSAYQDVNLVPIIARNTSYRVRARVASASGLTQGTLHVNLQSTAQSFTTAGLAIQASQLTANFVEFDALLTSALVNPPTDLLLQVYADGTPTNGGFFIIDSIEPYATATPSNFSTAWLSHAFNPESFDNTLDQVQVRPNDGQQLRSGFPLRNSFYLAKDHYLCYTTDDGVNEPSSWAVTEVSGTIGICGPNACDWNEEWAVFAERSGVYICWGSDPVKISQEIDTDATKTGKVAWDTINWSAASTIWVRIDKVHKQILIGAPINGAVAPNVIFMLDYQWLMTAQDIADSPMVTYSAFTGKMLAHGRGRRWTYWNITANSMTFAERTDGTAQPFFGNGSANGLIYQQQDATLQASDNNVAINSFWQSYFSPSSVEEQMMHLTSLRKLFGYLTFRASGAGSLNLTVTTATRATTLRAYTLSLAPPGDGGRSINIHGERAAFTVGTNAVGAWFLCEKLIPFMKKDAAIPVRGSSDVSVVNVITQSPANPPIIQQGVPLIVDASTGLLWTVTINDAGQLVTALSSYVVPKPLTVQNPVINDSGLAQTAWVINIAAGVLQQSPIAFKPSYPSIFLLSSATKKLKIYVQNGVLVNAPA